MRPRWSHHRQDRSRRLQKAPDVPHPRKGERLPGRSSPNEHPALKVIREGPRPEVPRGILTPVVRRRRHRVRPLLPLAVVAVAAGAVAVALLSQQSLRRSAPPPTRTQAPASRVTVPVQARRPLLAWPPRSHRLFSRPIAARGAIVVDEKSGRVLWAQHPRRRMPVASTTKIMTAVLALERLPPETLVTVAPAAARVPLVREGLRPRERVRAWKLLEGLLIYSGNDDALALAVATAKTRSAFVARMNEEAAKLRLRDTHFSTPSGVIDHGNYSSPADLAALTRVAFRDVRFR